MTVSDCKVTSITLELATREIYRLMFGMHYVSINGMVRVEVKMHSCISMI